MKIAATGLSGLVGSRIKELLGEKHEFEPIGLSAGVDIRDKDSIAAAIRNSSATIVLNLAGKADVDGSEEDRAWREKGASWQLNVVGAENVAVAAREFGKKLIHISSDFVFDGEKEFYTEEDVPHAVDWYGETKLEGEKAVQKAGGDFIIARIAYPYRAAFKKKDFVRAMISTLKEGKPINCVVDHIMTPTFIDDIAFALDALFAAAENGIYHVTGSTPVSPYDAAILICDKFNLDRGLVSKITREDYFKNKAPRPFRLYLKNDKIRKLGVKMRTFEEGLSEVKKQLEKK